MKKLIVLTYLIFSGLYGFSQEFDKALIAKASNDLCGCIYENISDPLDINEYFQLLSGTCINVIMSEDFDVFFEYVDENSEISIEKQGEIIGKNFYNKVTLELIQVCDISFQIFEDTKRINAELEKEVFKELELQSALTYINLEIEKNPTAELYLQRGLIFFADDKLEAAERDLIKSYNMKPITDIQQLVLFTYILELNGKFDLSIQVYENAIKNGDKTLMFLMEATKRKKRESK